MNLTEFSASLEALWRLHGTAYAWDELATFLGENVDRGAVLWLLARRREHRAGRVSYSSSDELSELFRFLGFALRQLRVRNETAATGHPDDAKETARFLAVTALAQSEVAGWYRADQDRRYGTGTKVTVTPDPGKSVPGSREALLARLTRGGL